MAGARQYIVSNYQYAWSVKSPKSVVMNIFGIAVQSFVFVCDPVFDVKASKRQRVEAGIVLFDKLRDQLALVVQGKDADKRFFERLEDYDILRRIGTFYSLEGDRLAQFQTRTK